MYVEGILHLTSIIEAVRLGIYYFRAWHLSLNSIVLPCFATLFCLEKNAVIVLFDRGVIWHSPMYPLVVLLLPTSGQFSVKHCWNRTQVAFIGFKAVCQLERHPLTGFSTAARRYMRLWRDRPYPTGWDRNVSRSWEHNVETWWNMHGNVHENMRGNIWNHNDGTFCGFRWVEDVVLAGAFQPQAEQTRQAVVTSATAGHEDQAPTRFPTWGMVFSVARHPVVTGSR